MHLKTGMRLRILFILAMAICRKVMWHRGSLDLLTGDEVITAFEHETFASFPKGNYTASSPVISYWNTFFQGLRQCYIFLENVDKVPDLD